MFKKANIYLVPMLFMSVSCYAETVTYMAKCSVENKNTIPGYSGEFTGDQSVYDLTSTPNPGMDEANSVCVGNKSKYTTTGKCASITKNNNEKTEITIVTLTKQTTKENEKCLGKLESLEKAKEGHSIGIVSNSSDNKTENITGLTYGTLLVPYKYQFGGDKSFSGNASLGGYIGFKQDRTTITGAAVEYVLFAGMSPISVQKVENGQKSTQTLTGFTTGVAIIGTVNKTFQVGAVLGWDHTSGNDYVNNHKPWIAFAIGYGFSK